MGGLLATAQQLRAQQLAAEAAQAQSNWNEGLRDAAPTTSSPARAVARVALRVLYHPSVRVPQVGLVDLMLTAPCASNTLSDLQGDGKIIVSGRSALVLQDVDPGQAGTAFKLL